VTPVVVRLYTFERTSVSPSTLLRQKFFSPGQRSTVSTLSPWTVPRSHWAFLASPLTAGTKSPFLVVLDFSRPVFMNIIWRAHPSRVRDGGFSVARFSFLPGPVCQWPILSSFMATRLVVLLTLLLRLGDASFFFSQIRGRSELTTPRTMPFAVPSTDLG